MTTVCGEFVDFSIGKAKRHCKITFIGASTMQAQCLETETKYLLYKKNGVWCPTLQSVSFAAPRTGDVETETHYYWIRCH